MEGPDWVGRRHSVSRDLRLKSQQYWQSERRNSEKKLQQTFGQPVQLSGKRAGDEADVAAFLGVLDDDVLRELLFFGQHARWHERVVACVDQQCRDANAAEPGFAGGAAPIVGGAGETV